jgi:class 3 adenylate cyclase/tetratricopeptide (TPR) repeat protein
MTTADSEAFGDVLRRLRKVAQLTQEELAERAGLSQRGINDLERGARQSPHKDTALQLADALNLMGDERAAFLTAARRAPPPGATPASATIAFGSPTADAADASYLISRAANGLSTTFPTGTVTFLFTDIEGSTQLLQRLGAPGYAQAITQSQALLRSIWAAHGGAEVDTAGDGFFVAFDSAPEAVVAAAEATRALAAHSWPAGEALRMRMGLHTGAPLLVGAHYFGLDVHRAARITAAGYGGQILLSLTTQTLVEQALPDGVSLLALGPQSLKDLRQPEPLYQLVLPASWGAPLDFPPLRTLDAQPTSTSAGPLPLGGFLGAAPDGPTVAREVELGALSAALTAVAAGAGRMVLLAGEPGAGKTRLAQEVSVAARAQGFLVATGRCYEPQAAVAYFPFLEALRHALAQAPHAMRAALPERWPDVARLLPGRLDQGARLPELPDTRGLGDDQQRLFWQVTNLVQALASERPVALLLDDLHWADGASLDLLAHLARHTRGDRVLLLGVYRDVEVTRQHPLEGALRDLGRERLLERIAVRRLDAEGTRALIGAALATETVSGEFARLLHARAEGNPFFTVEVLRDLVERGDLAQVGDQWRKPTQDEAGLPESVRAVIGQRVGRLSAESQAALQEASVLGQVFAFTDLQAMSARSEAELEVALEAAGAAALLRETGHERYAFPHVLIQQTLYSDLTIRRRARLHRAAGEALERLGERDRDRRVAELAFHFARTDQYRKAVRYAMQAADRARDAGARRDEAALLGEALEAATFLDDRDLESDLQVKRGKAFLAAGMPVEGSRDLEAALAGLPVDQVDQVDQRERRATVLVHLAQCLINAAPYLWSPGGTKHDMQRARECAAEALAIAEALGRDELVARAMSELAICDAIEGLLRESQVLFAHAFARAGSEHRSVLQNGIDQFGLNWYYLGQLTEAERYTRQALEIARNAHDVAVVVRTLANLGTTLTGCGRYDEALALFAEARRFGREQATWQWLARAISMCAGLHLTLGDYARAETLSEEAHEVSRGIQFTNAMASTGVDLLLTFARRQEPGRADGLLASVREAVVQTSGAHTWLVGMRFAQAQAEVALARGAPRDALDFTAESVAAARRCGRVKYEALGLQTHAQALDALGRTREAIMELRSAVDRARPVGDPALFLRVASGLLAIEGDDALLAETQVTIDRIAAPLPDELRRIFVETEPVRLVARLSRQSQ